MARKKGSEEASRLAPTGPRSPTLHGTSCHTSRIRHASIWHTARRLNPPTTATKCEAVTWSLPHQWNQTVNFSLEFIHLRIKQCILMRRRSSTRSQPMANFHRLNLLIYTLVVTKPRRWLLALQLIGAARFRAAGTNQEEKVGGRTFPWLFSLFLHCIRTERSAEELSDIRSCTQHKQALLCRVFQLEFSRLDNDGAAEEKKEGFF